MFVQIMKPISGNFTLRIHVIYAKCTMTALIIHNNHNVQNI